MTKSHLIKNIYTITKSLVKSCPIIDGIREKDSFQNAVFNGRDTKISKNREF